MKVVLDTNILFSGIAHPDGTPGRIISAWLEGRFDLVLSDALIEEFERVLNYPKIRKLLAGAGVTDDDLRDYLDIFRMKAIFVKTDEVVLEVKPADAKDIPVVAALVASGAEFLVTGDRKHPLVLGMPQIVTASDFLSRLQAFGLETR
jgi:putative PIN family toxin of toxin-antitoxin system